MTTGLLFDVHRCIGCRSCMQGCREANGLPDPRMQGPRPDRLDADNFTVVLDHPLAGGGRLHHRRLCMHCLDPACVSACPVSALVRRDDGAVVYDQRRCIGCRYCMIACPFRVPKYSWTLAVPGVRKCFLCAHRLDVGQEPACAVACPTGATRFGPRDLLLRTAHAEIAARPDVYFPAVFGEREAGGTGVLVMSPLPFGTLGYRVDVPDRSLPELTWRVQEKLPYVLATGGVVLGGLFWLIHRRIRLADERRERRRLEDRDRHPDDTPPQEPRP